MPFLFESPEVRIEAPPAPPAAPGMTPQEQQILDLEREIGLVNLEIQREQQAQDQAVRTSLEKELGGPLSGVLARQIADQTRFQSSLQGVQRLALQQAADERAAFQNATSMTPEQASAQEAAWQLRIRGPLQDRFEKALRGELAVNPALERSLDEQRMELEGNLLQRFGPGALIPSPNNPAMLALAEFDKRATELRTSAREGAVTEAEQVGMALVPATERVRRARAEALQTSGMPALPGALPSPLAPALQRTFLQTPPQLTSVRGALGAERAFQFAPQFQGYQNAVNFTNQLNQLGMQGALAQAQGTGGLINAVIGAGGTLGAAAFMRPHPPAPYINIGGTREWWMNPTIGY